MNQRRASDGETDVNYVRRNEKLDILKWTFQGSHLIFLWNSANPSASEICSPSIHRATGQCASASTSHIHLQFEMQPTALSYSYTLLPLHYPHFHYSTLPQACDLALSSSYFATTRHTFKAHSIDCTSATSVCAAVLSSTWHLIATAQPTPIANTNVRRLLAYSSSQSHCASYRHRLSPRDS